MQNVPEIVRRRLKAAAPSADHPDANALTAFAERSLGQDERALVLEHLGRCSDCRDIVALALPGMEPVETAWRPAATGWLTWPALRWGFAAAGIVAISALGVVEYQRRPATTASPARARVEVAGNESSQAKNQSLAPVYSATTKKAANLQVPAPYALTDAAGATDATLSEKKSRLRAIPPPARAPQQQVGSSHGTVVGGALTYGPRMQNQWQQQNAVQNQAAAAAPSSAFAKQQDADNLSANMRLPAVPETVAVESQSSQLDTQAQTLGRSQIDARQATARPAASEQSGEDYAVARVGKAKPAEAAPDANSGVVANRVAAPAVPQATGGAVLASSAPVPRWTINSTGGLERSLDQGTTWQVINVNANPVYFTATTSVQIPGSTSRTKVQKDASPVFRAVAASGVEVWAGGAGGALYHSQDAGDHWTRVLPTSSRAILTGDIISLEFSDMEHGKVSTSNAEVWTTTDNGQTWQKQ
jgi:Photosynthesis system II assembly factor YCF48